MNYIDDSINSKYIKNDSVTLLFSRYDDKIINVKIQDTLFEESEIYADFLNRKEELTPFNKLLYLENKKENKHYFIFLDSNETTIEKYSDFLNELVRRINILIYDKKIKSFNFYNFYENIDNKKHNTFKDFINVLITKDLEMNIFKQ